MTSMVLFYTFSYLSNTWLNRRQLDSLICLCIQYIAILVQFLYVKEVQAYLPKCVVRGENPHTHTLRERQRHPWSLDHHLRAVILESKIPTAPKRHRFQQKGWGEPEDIHKQFTRGNLNAAKHFPYCLIALVIAAS